MEAASHDQVIVDGQAAVNGRGLRHVADAAESCGAIPPGIDTVDLDVAGVGPLEGHADADECGLAGAVWPDESGHAAGRHGQIDVIECDLPLEALAQTVGGERESPTLDTHPHP